MQLKIYSIFFTVFLLLFLSISPSPVIAEEVTDGSKIFTVHCAGCHPNGNNIIRRGKNLKMRALKRNKVDTLDSIIHLVTYGKNNMSAYEEKLTQNEIKVVSQYVLEQAKNNWHNP
ncbi:c-type cytochrome [Crocosphaera chwakensis]|uniref:Cytochrome c, class I n=1 Tax=Crocosphaera chwakensis CCY0110 TaxID=391612 RepID=A3IW71_9CHRO|nr:c-type cytochrome [Crocosphaera chwakensis]EAZ89306.1 Cytochrome c, class I [Crocosphaera chwakensis CCY0110]